MHKSCLNLARRRLSLTNIRLKSKKKFRLAQPIYVLIIPGTNTRFLDAPFLFPLVQV